MAAITALTCALLLQNPAPPAAAPPEDLIAMTESGVQVEVAERPAEGALEVQTPYGLYRTPTDPVKLVIERQRDRAWVTLLRTRADANLLPTIRLFDSNGQITALLDVTEAALRRGRADEVAAALRALERWGALLDPVPAEPERSSDERVEWLWDRVLDTEGPRMTLLAGRMTEEVIGGENGVGPSQIKLVPLRNAIEDGRPLLRRAAILVAQEQLMDDPLFGALVQWNSVYGDVAVRDRAGECAVVLRPIAAREYWVRGLLRASDERRLICARRLAQHLPDYAPKPFAIVLAAVGKLAPRRFDFLDHSIQVVVTRNEPLTLRQLEFSFSKGGSEHAEYLENSSVIKLCSVPEELRRSLTLMLAELAGDDVERSLEEWLDWYRARVQGP